MRADKAENPLSRLVGVRGDTPAVSTSEYLPSADITDTVDINELEPKVAHSEKTNAVDEDGGGASTGEVGATGCDDSPLDNLSPLIEGALKFAERWPEIYRPAIFRLGLDRLIEYASTKPAAVSSSYAGRGSSSRGLGNTQTVMTRISGATAGHEPPVAPLMAGQKLARALNVEIDAIQRAVRTGENGSIAILGRLDGKSTKELQTRYSLVFLYVKEMALGNRMVDIDELRALCVEHGCYDQGNFTTNYKKDVMAGLLREDGAKGSRTRRYMLSRRGVDEAASLLRAMAEQ
jgi:hypothetical protein